MTSHFLSQLLPLFATRWLFWPTNQPDWNHENGLYFQLLIKPFWHPNGGSDQWEALLSLITGSMSEEKQRLRATKEVCHVLDFRRTGLKRLQQCSRHSWNQRKWKEENTNSCNENWRCVTGLYLRPTRLFSFLDNNAAKSRDCQADRKLNVAFISPAFPFYSPSSFALRFLLSEHPLHWALFCPPPKLPLLSKCGFSQDWVKSCAFFFPFCNYTNLLPFPNLHVRDAGGGSLKVLFVYRCPAKQ